MTAEQAPGMPWHDHEWVEITVLGSQERNYICAFDPAYRLPRLRPGDEEQIRVPGSPTRCPAVKTEPIYVPHLYLDSLLTILSADPQEIAEAARDVALSRDEVLRRLEAFGAAIRAL